LISPAQGGQVDQYLKQNYMGLLETNCGPPKLGRSLAFNCRILQSYFTPNKGFVEVSN